MSETEEAQDGQTNSSYPYMTTACLSMMFLNFMIYPIRYQWKKMFPEFKSLSRDTRRNDVNMILRTLAGIPIFGVIIYMSVKTFIDVNWFIQNRTFNSYWLLVFLLIDMFDLSQKHKFDWQPYVHHSAQTIYGLYLFEWGPHYKYSFPALGLVAFSLMARPMLLYFPLKRVTSKTKSYAKFSFWTVVISVSTGFALMVGLIIQHRESLPLVVKVGSPVVYVFFQTIDLPIYIYIFKKAYGGVRVEPTQTGRRSSLIQIRTSLIQVADNLDDLVSNKRASILGLPYFRDGNDLEMTDFIDVQGGDKDSDKDTDKAMTDFIDVQGGDEDSEDSDCEA